MSKSRDAIEAQRTALSAVSIGTSVQAYDADTAKLDVEQTYTAAQTFGTVAVTGNVDGRDVSVDGAKLDTVATSANNYSHPANHAISVVTGLQTALDAKVDDSQVLTNVPSGALFTDTDTDTVYTHPSNHAISVVTGLQTALDGKVDDSQVLTNVPSGALFTDTVYTHPANHAISVISGLQAALDSKLTSSGIATIFPFFKSDGSSDTIAITNAEFPFFKSDGSQDNIGVS
jgi:phage tail sheath protein FI